MKKILLLLLLLGATVSTMMAQTSTFGYSFVPRSSEAYNDEASGLGLDGPGKRNVFVMKLSKRMATQYAGGKVLRFSIAVNQPLSGVKIIAGDTAAAAIAAMTQLVDLKRGWNDIELTTPMDIVADKEIFFGVTNEVLAQERPYVYESYYAPEGVFYYKAMDQWIDLNTYDPQRGKRPLGVPLMGISGVLPTGKATNLSFPATFTLGQYNKRGGFNLPVLVANLGSNDLTKIEGTFRTLNEKNNEIVPPAPSVLDLSSKPLKAGEVRFVEAPVSLQKTGRFSIKLDKANGVVSEIAQELTGSSTIVYSEENIYPRTSIVEYSVSEDADVSPQFEDAIQRHLQPTYGDMAVFVRYCPATYLDGTNLDPYAIAKGEKIHMMFPISMPMTPASVVDRQGALTFPMKIEDDIKSAKTIPGWAKVDGSIINYSQKSRELKVQFKGKISVDVPYSTDETYYATLLLCENKLPAINQKFPEGMPQSERDAFRHDHVLRDVLTETLSGIKLELNADHEYDLTLTTTLKNEWKAHDMYVVGMIHRAFPKTPMPATGPGAPAPDPAVYQAALKERLNAQILNTYAIMLNGWRVDAAQVENTDVAPTATIIEGQLQLYGDYDTIAVYDINGSVCAPNTPLLTGGVYVVRMTKGTQVFVQKLICP